MRATPIAATDPSDGRTRYAADRPTDLRRARPWHRLAYVVNELPRRLTEIISSVETPAQARILDFGCADGPYWGLFGGDAEVTGADLPGNPTASVEIGPDGRLPVPHASFDLVLSTQVLEHVTDPDVYLEECHRVLRPGGRLVLSTHGIMVYHPDPVDYWRWTTAGLQRVVTDHGFDIERFDGIVGLGATGVQLVHDAWYWRLPRRVRAPFSLVAQTLMAMLDRLETPRSRRGNAMVFALVAVKR